MEKFLDTTATKKIFKLKKRIRAVSGGTSASKTISILVWLIDYAQSTPNELISVVSESFPHLSGGAMLDFEKIMRTQGYWKEERWVRNPRAVYTFETGTKIEFISVDTVGKAHGPRRDVLYVNECNNLSYEIVDQLITRTRKIVWLDWNPSSEFWFYEKMLAERPDDIDFIGDGGNYPPLTYLDNEALDEVMINEIESHKSNKRWWTVYGKGQLGEIEGRIYTGWKIIPEVPHEAKLVRRPLDFGYSVDQSGIVDMYEYDGGLVLDELLYLKGQSNKQLADFILNQPEQCLVVGDSAEPKSIAEIKSYGVNIVGAIKKKEAVGKYKTYNQWAIAQVQSYKKISVTERSLNLIKEYRNYVWAQDNDGNYLGEPEKTPDHLLDPVKYGVVSLISKISTGVSVSTPQYAGFNRVASTNQISINSGIPQAPRTMPTIVRHRG